MNGTPLHASPMASAPGGTLPGGVKPTLRNLYLGFGILAAAGILGFSLLAVFGYAERAWQVYLINFLFFSAIAQGGLLFSMIMHVTQARWTGPLSGISEAFSAFFPVSFLLFLGLIAGRQHIFPWLGQDLHGKEVWLNLPFLFSRDAVGLLLLHGLGMAYVFHAFGNKLSRAGDGAFRRLVLSILDRCRIDEVRRRERMTRLAVAYMIAYAVVLSLISFDLVMSLEPHWISTLFGGYFFVKAFYVGLGGLILVAGAAHLIHADRSRLTTSHFHDLGKLFFAFCMVWAYFLYAQVLVIWYGNVPEETHYLIQRFHHTSWKLVLILAFGAAFVLPFFLSMNERAKKKPAFLMAVAGSALVGIWLENLLLVGPAFPMDTTVLAPRIFDVLVSLGFFGLLAMSVTTPLVVFPELVLRDDAKGES